MAEAGWDWRDERTLASSGKPNHPGTRVVHPGGPHSPQALFCFCDSMTDKGKEKGPLTPVLLCAQHQQRKQFLPRNRRRGGHRQPHKQSTKSGERGMFDNLSAQAAQRAHGHATRAVRSRCLPTEPGIAQHTHHKSYCIMHACTVVSSLLKGTIRRATQGFLMHQTALVTPSPTVRTPRPCRQCPR